VAKSVEYHNATYIQLSWKLTRVMVASGIASKWKLWCIIVAYSFMSQPLNVEVYDVHRL